MGGLPVVDEKLPEVSEEFVSGVEMTSEIQHFTYSFSWLASVQLAPVAP